MNAWIDWLHTLHPLLTESGMRNLAKKPSNTDEYLALLPAEQQRALQKLREQIQAAAPQAEEYFGYGLPGFKHNGHPLVYMGAAKNHLALYGMIPLGLRDRLKDFKLSKGTIQFTSENPLPAALVRDIVRMKRAEIELRWPVKKKKAAPTKTAKKK